jgi:hypothetical protein
MDKRNEDKPEHGKSEEWGIEQFEKWLGLQGRGQAFVKSDPNIYNAVKAAYMDGLNTGLRNRA